MIFDILYWTLTCFSTDRIDLSFAEYEENPLVSRQYYQDNPPHNTEHDDVSKSSTKLSRGSSKGSNKSHSRHSSRSHSPHSHHSRSRSHSPAKDSPLQGTRNRKGVSFATSHLPSPIGAHNHDYYDEESLVHVATVGGKSDHTADGIREKDRQPSGTRNKSSRAEPSNSGRSDGRNPNSTSNSTSTTRHAKDGRGMSRSGSGTVRKGSSSRSPSRRHAADPSVLKPSRSNVEL